MDTIENNETSLTYNRKSGMRIHHAKDIRTVDPKLGEVFLSALFIKSKDIDWAKAVVEDVFGDNLQYASKQKEPEKEDKKVIKLKDRKK